MSAERSVIVASIVALLLVVIKAVIGVLSGSLALVSDALHSLTDLVSYLASWFAIKLSRKKPDEKFPYGYYKAENLATLVISGFMVYGAVNLMLRAVQNLDRTPTLEIPMHAMAAALLSALVSYLVSNYLAKAGRKYNSPSLIAESNEKRVDAISSFTVFLAVLLTYYGVPYADSVVSIFVSLLILRIGIPILKDAVFALMDVSPSKELEESIRELIKKEDGVEDVSGLKLRMSGAVIFGEVTVRVKPFIDVKRAHEVADKIEEKIKKKFKNIESITVHFEPAKRKKELLAIPVKEKTLNSEVMNHFARANCFVFAEIKEKKLSKTWIERNPFKEKKIRVGLSVSHWLVKKRVTAIVTKEIGEISFHTLRDHLITVYMTNGNTAREVIDNFISGKLQYLKKPTRERI